MKNNVVVLQLPSLLSTGHAGPTEAIKARTRETDLWAELSHVASQTTVPSSFGWYGADVDSTGEKTFFL